MPEPLHVDVLYHPETKYLDQYIEIADAIELAFPSVVVRGNEKDDDDALGRHVAEEEEEEEDYFRVECEDEIIAEMTTERGRLPRLEDIVEALEKKVTEKEKKDASGGGCG